MLASFAVIPLGVGEELKVPVAEIIKLVKAAGLPYRVGAMQTTVEGEPDQVFALIRQCHARMRDLAPRVLTTITIDDRAGAQGRLTGKVADVEALLRTEVSRE